MQMDTSEKLRTCHPGDRKSVTLSLARDDDEAISELINMAEGGVMNYTQRTLGTLWRRIPRYYCLSDQILGIEALSESRSPKALDFLRHVYTPSVSTEDRSESFSQGGDTFEDHWKVEVHKYPNAPLKLSEQLEFEVSLSRSDWTFETKIPEPEIEEARRAILEQNKTHRLIRKAIEKLELALNTG